MTTLQAVIWLLTLPLLIILVVKFTKLNIFHFERVEKLKEERDYYKKISQENIQNNIT